jgi:glycosyltransferase involved in cell wall biosynthesis
VVVSVGRLAREKSVDLLAAAIEVAVAADPRVRLLLIGEGPERASLDRRATEPPTLLHLAGGMPRLDALALAAGSDLFAFTSATETQGLVLAEALARGLPVVALEGPGVRDSIRDGVDGIVVPREPRATAAERLGAAIAGLAADQEKRGALSAAALAGAGRFAIAERIAEIERLYREVLAHR